MDIGFGGDWGDSNIGDKDCSVLRGEYVILGDSHACMECVFFSS